MYKNVPVALLLPTFHSMRSVRHAELTRVFFSFQRKQKDVQKENDFYVHLLQQALPAEQQSAEKQKGASRRQSVSQEAFTRRLVAWASVNIFDVLQNFGMTPNGDAGFAIDGQEKWFLDTEILHRVENTTRPV